MTTIKQELKTEPSDSEYEDNVPGIQEGIEPEVNIKSEEDPLAVDCNITETGAEHSTNFSVAQDSNFNASVYGNEVLFIKCEDNEYKNEQHDVLATLAPNVQVEVVQVQSLCLCENSDDDLHLQSNTALCLKCKKPKRVISALPDSSKDSSHQWSVRRDHDYSWKEKLLHPCAICNKTFKSPGALTNHHSIHYTGKGKLRKYFCDLCERIFSHRASLIGHRRTHTGEKPFSCDYCNRSFTEKGQLKTHKRIHTKEAPYSCKICNQKFVHSGSLKSHNLIHNGEKPYTCNICSKSFRQHGGLRKHIRNHSGDRPHVCEFCGKSFLARSELLTHRRVHTGERPYMCVLCNRSFSQKCSFNAHQLRHTREQLFNCAICNNSYVVKEQLKRHIHSKHVIDLPQKSDK